MNRPPSLNSLPPGWLGFLDLIPDYLLDGSASSRGQVLACLEMKVRHLTARGLDTAGTAADLVKAIEDGHLTLRGMTPLYHSRNTRDLRKREIFTPLYATDEINNLTFTTYLKTTYLKTTWLTNTNTVTTTPPSSEDDRPLDLTDDVLNNIPSHLWRGPTSFNRIAFWLADVAEEILETNILGANLLLEAAEKLNSAAH
ncbi:hypothetical protein HII31_07672 [Pseudocercospora fuligena]|uniref:Uncharacterized protein n=1 Tax=Pseudocercospora fuligena TaxID=685502 RepID=A0A8H6RFN2_9PEZI|nr:hypothetical protein HII31_07672 [Pseudocercospora fuligena]